MGSKSTINYGAKGAIAFSNKIVKEYFDVANIDYYDVILGMLFLWWLRITLDFTGQGTICRGTYVVLMKKPLVSSFADLPKTTVGKQLKLKPPE